FDPELDELTSVVENAQATLLEMERREREQTGIRSLKVGFNKVFGYYIEVTKPNLKFVPERYIRRQTLANGERFVTPELKEWEARILRAEERIAARARAVFAGVVETVGAQVDRLLATAQALAELDVLATFAELAAARRYSRPMLDDSTTLCIRAGRHPVVELALEAGAFVPNDTNLSGADGPRLLLVTGPNMAGKSTYLRQVALIVLLAQVGCFVPAEAACIGAVDRIFTRIGAQDDLAAGASTFLVEMVETAAILRHATARSLLVFDEIGRGTSTFDGLAIAQAVVEDVHDRVRARTLFATHFHELTALAERLPAMRVATMAAIEEGRQVVFLRRLVPGGADRSYGIHVARLAGLPEHVTRRAEALLAEMEQAR
ncbi:MAG: DNA mismatch repair protein MutS, partial [Chloroflexota bacterium]